MSQVTIPDLPENAGITGDEFLEISNNGISEKLLIADLTELYQLRIQRNVPNGYAGLDVGGLIDVDQIPGFIPAVDIADGSVDNNEYQFLNGVTSGIQTQLNSKENSAEKGAANGYAGLDSSQELLLVNFPNGTALQFLRRNTANDALEFADVIIDAVTSINNDTTAAQTLVGTSDIITIADDNIGEHTFDVGNLVVLTNRENTYEAGKTQTFSPNNTMAGLNVGQHTTDPTNDVNGDVYYNSTSNRFRVFQNGEWVDTLTGTVEQAQTPWLQDINADGFDLKDLSNLEFRDTTEAPLGSVLSIWGTVSALNLNTPNNDSINFKVNLVDVMTLNSTELNLQQNKIINSVIGHEDFSNDIHADTVHVQVRNQSGVTLTVGDAIYVSGFSVSEDLPLVSLANATSNSTMPAFGIVGPASISNNQNGSVFISGRLLNVNTSSFSAGDILYVSNAGTTGNTLTSTKPTGSDLIQAIGQVLKSDASGVLEIEGAGQVNELPNLATHLLDMNNFKISNISPTTITDLDLVTAKSGDLIWIVDATDGLNKNVDALDFLAAASQTPWTSDINANDKNLENLGVIDFSAKPILAGTIPAIYFASTVPNSMIFNVPTTNFIVLRVNGNTEFTFSSTLADFHGNDIENAVLETGIVVNASISWNNFRQTFNPSPTDAGINFGAKTNLDPSAPVNGDVYYNSTNNKFRAYQNGAWIDLIGGGTGVQTPWGQNIDAAGFDLENLSNIVFGNTTEAPGATDRSIYYSDSTGMQFNALTGDVFIWKFNDLPHMTLSASALDLDGTISIDNATDITMNGRLILTNDDGDGFIQMNSIASPGVTTGPTVGRIFMDSGNSNHLSIIRDGSVVDLEDTGTGSQTPWTQEINAAGNNLINLSNLEFQVTAASPLPATPSIHFISTDMIFNIPTGDSFSFRVNGSEKVEIATTFVDFKQNLLVNLKLEGGAIFVNTIIGWLAGKRQTFSPDNVNAGLNVGNNATEPTSPDDGDMFYDSTADALKARINGSWVELGAGGGSQTPWTGNIDAANNDLFDLGNIKFINSLSTPIVDPAIYYSTSVNPDALVLNVPSGNEFIINVNGVEEYAFDSSKVDFNGNTIISLGGVNFNGTATLPIVGTTSIYQTSTFDALVLSVPVDDAVSINVVDVEEYRFDATVANFKDNDLRNVKFTFAVKSGNGIIYDDGVKQTFNPNSSNAGLNVGQHSGLPLFAVDGDIVYDTTADELRARIDGSWIALGGGTGSQTPWGQDIAAAGFDLRDLSNLEFRNTTASPAGSVPSIYYSTLVNPDSLIINIPSGDELAIYVNGVEEYTFSSTIADFGANDIANVRLTSNIFVDNSITWAETKQVFNPGESEVGFNVGQHSAEPFVHTNGDMFFDSTDVSLKASINGVWVDLGVGAAQTPWTQDINAAGNNLDDLGIIDFALHVGTPPISTATILLSNVSGTDTMSLSVPSVNDRFIFNFGGFGNFSFFRTEISMPNLTVKSTSDSTISTITQTGGNSILNNVLTSHLMGNGLASFASIDVTPTNITINTETGNLEIATSADGDLIPMITLTGNITTPANSTIDFHERPMLTGLDMNDNFIKNISTIQDLNGNDLLTFGSIASAVNSIQVTNSVSGSPPIISPGGPGANIGLIIKTKGIGELITVEDDILFSVGLRSFGRILNVQGPSIASGGTITMSTGNYCLVTGNTDINFITTTEWFSGSFIVLRFSGPLRLNNETGGAPVNTANLQLKGGTFFDVSADTTIMFVFELNVWREISRSENS